MTLKEKHFTLDIDETEVKEICEALEERINTLEEALKNGGGVLTEKHLETSQSLFNTFSYLRRVSEYSFYD